MGAVYGLDLVMHTREVEYIPTTISRGIRVLVHPADMDPFPDHGGQRNETRSWRLRRLGLKSLMWLGRCKRVRLGKVADLLEDGDD